MDFSQIFASMMTTMESLYKSSYDLGFYSDDMMRGFVKNGSLTAEGYERITGDPYEATAAESD